jgi:hypothetical protein
MKNGAFWDVTPCVVVSSSECRSTSDMQTANTTFENVSQFKYLGTTATSQRLSGEEIKGRHNSVNGPYRSVQNFLSSRLLSLTVKI